MSEVHGKGRIGLGKQKPGQRQVLHDHTYVPQARCRQHLDGVLCRFVAGLVAGDAADSQQLNARVVACSANPC